MKLSASDGHSFRPSPSAARNTIENCMVLMAGISVSACLKFLSTEDDNNSRFIKVHVFRAEGFS